METVLEISGAVAKPLSLSLADLRESYPPYSVETSFYNGKQIVTPIFTGARLWDVLTSAQVTANPEVDSHLRIMAQAKDGVRCWIQWNEFNPAVTDRQVLIGYEQDGEPLGSGGDPLRLVVPGDERGERYLRGLMRITLLTQADADN